MAVRTITCVVLFLSLATSGCVAVCNSNARKEMRGVEIQRASNRDWLEKRLKWADWRCLHEITEEECMQLKAVTYNEFTRAQITTDNDVEDIRMRRAQCIDDAQRSSAAVAASLSEMGRSMQQSQRNQVHCTSQVIGSTVYTDCR